MPPEKTLLLQQLDEARHQLWSVLEVLEPSDKVNPEWNKRDFYAHIAGWEAIVYETFCSHLEGVSVKSYPFTSVDDANREFVAARQSLSEEGAKLECEIYRFAIKTLLQGIDAEDYDKPIRFPWGSDTLVEFIQGAIAHELDHAAEIVRMKQANPSR
jgi:hypothetical protein